MLSIIGTARNKSHFLDELGKTIGGEPVIVDLARMPHLLVAGTTGSGKSVAINTMILSLLYRLKPEECRLIMVDPQNAEAFRLRQYSASADARRHRSEKGGGRAQMGGARDGGPLQENGDVRHTAYTQSKNDYFNNIAEGSLLYRDNLGLSVDEVFTVNPTDILDVRLNFTRMNEGHNIPSVGFNPTTLGLPSYLGADSNYLQMPVISFNSATGMQALGASGANKLPSQSYQVFPTWSKIVGAHTLKAGGDFRQYRLNTFTAGNSTGSFTFNNSWVRSSSSASSTVAVGQDFASFMFGLPASGSYDLNTYASWYSYYAAVFLEDDWRVKHNLTVNLGVRFDHDGPYNEKYGRTLDGFDTTDTNPLAAAAQAAYAKSPLSQLPASAFNVLGGVTFPGSGQTAVYKNNSHLVSPRAGVAWTPDAFHGKTVIRGSFAMFVAPVSILAAGVDDKDSTSPDTNQEGFSQNHVHGPHQQ